MRVLVTGGGGFLGQYIVEQLLARGHQVRVFCRGNYAFPDGASVETVRGDLRDAAAVSAACREMECVFHTAAIAGIWGSWQAFHDINTLGTQHVIDACFQHGVTRLVYTSSPSVVFDGGSHHNGDESLPYPADWMCHYSHSKALAEQAVIAAGQPGSGRDRSLQTISLRPHLIWGPRDNHLIPRLIQRARSGRLKQIGDGTNRVSVTYVENAAAAHLQAEAAMRSCRQLSGRVYFINEPEPVNLWQWINLLLERAGMPSVSRSMPYPVAHAIGGLCEWLYRIGRISNEPPMTRFLAAQLAGSHCYSIAAAQRDLNFQPQVSMEEGLDRLQPELLQLASG